MANSLLGQEPRTVDKRIQATIQDEINYLSKYGSDYWNSGTTGLLGWGAFSGVQQSLGASGRGERAWNNLNEINFKMKGGYSQEELWNMFNDELINTFPENDDYRLSIELMDRERYGLGGPVSRLITKLLKKHKDDIDIKALSRKLKRSNEDIEAWKFTEGDVTAIRKLEELGYSEKEIYDLIDQHHEDFVFEGAPGRLDKYLALEIEKKRTKKAGGGTTEDQMNALAISVAPARIEEQQLPDEEMEADYVDYVVDETLSTEDQDYLDSALAKDDRLSGIFDQVVESAAEFSGSGPIEGPGTEVSDSIPARLSDGEFVFTAKAVEEIGADVLQQQMKTAEAKADQRQGAAYGGLQTEKEDEIAPIQTTGLRTARRNVPVVAPTRRQVEEEMLKSSPRRFYQPLSG